MTDKAKKKLLVELFEDFKSELTMDNVDDEWIIKDANADEAYCFDTPRDEPYEVFLRQALGRYLSTWAEDWGAE